MLHQEGIKEEAKLKMNWIYNALQPRKKGRGIYDQLVGMLMGAYDLFGSMAGNREIGAPLIDHKIHAIGPMPAGQFVECAKSLVGRVFADPLSEWPRPGFWTHGSATVDPLVPHILKRLEVAHSYLPTTFAICLAKLVKQPGRPESHVAEAQTAFRRFSNPPSTTDETATDWQKSWWQLRKILNDAPAQRAAPWTWLGINLLAHSLPRENNIFPNLSPEKEKLLRVIIMSGDIGPCPDFVRIIRDALSMIAEDLNQFQSRDKVIQSLTQKQLAEFINVSENTVRNWAKSAEVKPRSGHGDTYSPEEITQILDQGRDSKTRSSREKCQAILGGEPTI